MSVNESSPSQEFVASDPGELVSSSAVQLPSHQGRAAPPSEAARKQLGSKDFKEKLFDYQHVTNFSVNVGTAALTEFQSFNFMSLCNVWMKYWMLLHDYCLADLDVQIVNAGNSGLSGTYVVGKRLTGEIGTINELSDDARTVRQFRSGAIFDMVLKPITNSKKTTLPLEFSSILTKEVNSFYPVISFITHSDLESTFSTSTLKAQFAVYSRFSKNSKFIQMGIPRPLGSGDTPSEPGFVNPQSLYFNKFLDSKCKLYGDGSYGFNHHKTGTQTRQLIMLTPGFFTDTPTEIDFSNASSVSLSANVTNFKLDNIASFDVSPYNSAALYFRDGDVSFGELNSNNNGEDVSFTPYPRPTLECYRVEVSKANTPSGELTELMEQLDLAASPLYAHVYTSNNNAWTAKYSGKDVLEAPFTVLGMGGWEQSEYSFIHFNDRATAWVGLDGQVHHMEVEGSKEVYCNMSGGGVILDYEAETKARKVVDLSTKGMSLSLEVGLIKDTNVLQTNGLKNLTSEHVVQLPPNCVAVNLSTRSVVPLVPKANAAQELPTIIPELSLFDFLAQFYDPKKTFQLHCYDDAFNQLSFDLVFSGPNQCVFIKSTNLPSLYFILDKPFTNFHIGQCIDISDSASIPSSIVDAPVIDRTSSTAMKKQMNPSRGFRYQGNVASAIGVGGDAISKILAIMEGKGEVESELDMRMELQKLIGEQGMQQLMAQIKANSDLMKQQSDLEIQNSSLHNPAFQNAAGQTSINTPPPTINTPVSVPEVVDGRLAPPKYSVAPLRGETSVFSPSSTSGISFVPAEHPDEFHLGTPVSDNSLVGQLANSARQFRTNGTLLPEAYQILSGLPKGIGDSFV